MLRPNMKLTMLRPFAAEGLVDGHGDGLGVSGLPHATPLTLSAMDSLLSFVFRLPVPCCTASDSGCVAGSAATLEASCVTGILLKMLFRRDLKFL